jgi:DtxR family Mn-dependent transcriptional regulator
MLTEAVGDYLKTVYALGGDGERVTTGALAESLGVSPASVTGMLRRLAAHDPPLVAYEKHRGAALTEEGRRRALEMVRHHRLLELFLHETLGLPWDEVHREAERLEHVISEELEERIARRLGHPETDPHGDPIPSREGKMPVRPEISLDRFPSGRQATVSRVSDQDPALLRYLAGIGLQPGARIVVVGTAPFDGPVSFRLSGSEVISALARSVASRIHLVRSDHAGGPGQDSERET